MKLLHLELYKCKRLSLGQIEKFIINPSTPIQFIIGTNGSGKTSIIQEMSPFPPDKNDFQEGGYKRAIFSLNGKTIEVLSQYEGGSSEHSFIVDGQEHNPGGTLRVQQELCRNYFHYTEEIHQLITNISADAGLTSMSLADRKKWFTLLANSNYDYAVSVFKKAQEKYNETKGALKRNKQRYAVESVQILNQEQIQQLKDQCDTLQEQLKKIYEIKQPSMTDPNLLMEQANKGALTLKEICLQIKSIYANLNGLAPGSLQEGQILKSKLEAQYESIQSWTNQVAQQYEEFNKKYQTAKKNHLQNAASLSEKIENTNKEIEQIYQSLKVCKGPISQPQSALNACEAIIASWMNHSDIIQQYKNEGYSRQTYLSLKNALESLTQTIEQTKNTMSKLEQIVEHQKGHEKESSVTCPHCQSVFQPNFSAEKLKNALDRLEKMSLQHNQLKEKYQEQLQIFKQCEMYLNHLSAFNEEVSRHPVVFDLTDTILNKNMVTDKPGEIMALLLNYQEDIKKLFRVKQLQEQLETDKYIYQEVAKQHNEQQIQDLEQENTAWLEKIHHFEMQKANKFSEISSLNKHLQNLKQLEILNNRLNKGIEYTDQKLQEAQESMQRNLVDSLLDQLQLQWSEKNKALNNARKQQSVVDHIKNEIDSLERENKEWLILTQELSPTKGLIAEGIYGFMKTMIEQMNKTLEQLFSYSLEVMPCTSEGEDISLTYRFPLKVGDDIRSDVSKGSSGMREVINLSFAIAVMKALGIGDYMLFLDEFGSKLDPVHKQAANMLLGSMLELERFEQVYMISHDITQYNAFGKSQICVLHQSNVQLPPNCTYNQHVHME